MALDVFDDENELLMIQTRLGVLNGWQDIKFSISYNLFSFIMESCGDNSTANVQHPSRKIKYPDKITLPLEDFCNFYFRELSNISFNKRKATAYNDIRALNTQYLKDHQDEVSYEFKNMFQNILSDKFDFTSIVLNELGLHIAEYTAKAWCSIFLTKSYVNSNLDTYTFLSKTKSFRVASEILSNTQKFIFSSEILSSNKSIEEYYSNWMSKGIAPSDYKRVMPLVDKILII
jgi:hypothetical protein